MSILQSYHLATTQEPSLGSSPPESPQQWIPFPPYEEGQEVQKRAYEDCLEDVLTKPYPNDGRLYCKRYWDTWSCWNDTPAGDTAFKFCPAFVAGYNPSYIATKYCTVNGTWWRHPISNVSWADYTGCVDTSELEMNQATIYMYITGFSVSIVAVVLSLIIFFGFKQLQCDRITIHKNLFISYVLAGLGWIIYYTSVALNVRILASNPLWCRIVHVLVQYLTMCNFFWMFNEGMYLHTVIVVAFTSGRMLLFSCYIIGWGLPVLVATVYAGVRGAYEKSVDQQCLIHSSVYDWILYGPIILSLFVNIIFLLNIVRVLMTKLRAINSSDTNQYRKAVRATLILVPLLGLQFVLFPMKPDDPEAQKFYMLFSAFVSSFQGLFVALIFCFLNGEVIGLLRRKWEQYRLMKGQPITTRRPSATTYTMTELSVNVKRPSTDKVYTEKLVHV